MDAQWTKFTKRIPIRADGQQIYTAWTCAAWLENWFLRKAVFTTPGGQQRKPGDLVEKGDSYEWYWHGYGDSVVEKGKVLDANGKDLFEFSFAGNCRVTVSIKTEAGENIVELTQVNIPIDENPFTNLLVGCGEGWTFYLANLKSILEGGIDLRNKNVEIKKVISF